MSLLLDQPKIKIAKNPSKSLPRAGGTNWTVECDIDVETAKAPPGHAPPPPLPRLVVVSAFIGVASPSKLVTVWGPPTAARVDVCVLDRWMDWLLD